MAEEEKRRHQEKGWWPDHCLNHPDSSDGTDP
jgi:hypothetical protein